MITLTLPDGATREITSGTTGGEFAKSIATSLGKAALAIKLDGEIRDLDLPITDSANVEIITRKSDEALELIRHDAAHVMAEAVQELFPGTQVTIGPAIENGFYYDFARNEPFTTDDLPAIEAKMREIIKRNAPFEREVWDRDEAIKFFEDKGEAYKAELIRDLPDAETITVYKQGDWLDLCRGPHMRSTGDIGEGFKLMKVAGAYWRGDSNRAMLTRIYGTAWRDKNELTEHLTMLEEAEKRDHRKLGREMDLFHLQEEAQGSVFWHPKGYRIYRLLENYIRARLEEADYQEVKTPQLIDRALWEASGHWEKFRENMFTVDDEGDRVMAIKPMNCPAHVQIFNQGIKSYRDLPLRMAEFGCCHRNEAHGALHGLMRVRQMTQDDAHIFCREDQITSESVAFCSLLESVYEDLGFTDIVVKLATRPDVRAGTDETWDRAERGLEDALVAANLPYEITPGEGAFYGPKLEFHLKDAIGRSWQCGTLQLDFVLPERLDANYTGEDGNKHRPVMLHRAILGTLERFIGIMIENYAGKLPLWLAPVQVVVATITSEGDDYAQEVAKLLEARGLRVETDLRNEKIGYKVREHSLQKVPNIIAVGGREVEERTVALRQLGEQGQKFMSLDEALDALTEAAKSPLEKRGQ
ncbi:MAG TPA: threonine--tRNA ligase [Rhodospirillaceae bacterium]|nr:threonine--tRNA ligase [Alphaproteobacteria bacterium]MAX96403.1 threonine--tRNA ligase [Alphaproteobacteria bacterium]MBN51968.1 threonine--tRNA ligase [Alphaproteobacteria bacterium]HCI47461.1 threonine--tRNA ligase [Rhodospirillaceae bacterium]